MVRVRHYTRKNRKGKILADDLIRAGDQNKVFIEYADADPLGPREAEARSLLKPGKGNAHVEFDVEEDEIEEQKNPRTGRKEFFLRGDVDLNGRDAKGFDNR